MEQKNKNVLKERIKNCLWGLFIGDALSMPVHWYYSRKNLKADFPEGIDGYKDPKHPHPEAFMVGMEYRPDTDRAKQLNRPFDILHEHARFYRTSYSEFTIKRTEREGEHGNAVAAEEERYHYHHGMKRGENTLGAHLARVLMRSVIEKGGYDRHDFLDRYVKFLTTPGSCSDPYREVYVRNWFENYSRGEDPLSCAELQACNWSIGSHGGMIRPMVVSLLHTADPYGSLGLAVEHQNLTHRSENVTSALHIVIPLLHDLLRKKPFIETALAYSSKIRLPKITGKELYKTYRDHKGPGNIPDNTMWKLHTDLRDEYWDLKGFAAEHSRDEVIGGELATACYPEHGLPLMLYLGYMSEGGFTAVLRANAEAGGDNVHRGMVLGMLAGAGSDEIPAELKDGLADRDVLAREIDEFADLSRPLPAGVFCKR